MKAVAKKYYPPFADAKTCKDNFISLMAQLLIVPSVDNIPETYVGKDDECLVLDTSKIKAPPDRPKTNRNKKQKRIPSTGESGPSRKSRAVYKGSQEQRVSAKKEVITSIFGDSKGQERKNVHEENDSQLVLSTNDSDKVKHVALI